MGARTAPKVELMETVTDPLKALFVVGKENSELHEELARVYSELDWYRRGLEYIQGMPNDGSAVAERILQKRPYK